MPNNNNNKPKAKAKSEPEQQKRNEEYLAKEPGTYEPPKHMVPMNDDRYMKKDRIGKQKAVRGPGQSVTKVGLGGLEVITQNPINYHGNIDV
jgi:hypothetical protein